MEIGETYVEHSLNPFTRDERTVDSLIHGSSHPDGAEVVEVQMMDEATWAWIVGSRHCPNPSKPQIRIDA
jgi:hypothetical protein